MYGHKGIEVGVAVFPGTVPLDVGFPKPPIADAALVKGEKALILLGCFTYVTFGAAHHTAFCFYYREGVSKFPNLSFCVGAFDAD